MDVLDLKVQITNLLVSTINLIYEFDSLAHAEIYPTFSSEIIACVSQKSYLF